MELKNSKKQSTHFAVPFFPNTLVHYLITYLFNSKLLKNTTKKVKIKVLTLRRLTFLMSDIF